MVHGIFSLSIFPIHYVIRCGGGLRYDGLAVANYFDASQIGFGGDTDVKIRPIGERLLDDFSDGGVIHMKLEQCATARGHVGFSTPDRADDGLAS